MKLASFGGSCPVDPTFIRMQNKHKGINHGRTDWLVFYGNTAEYVIKPNIKESERHFNAV